MNDFTNININGVRYDVKDETSRNLAGSWRNEYNVLDFGASGDGVTDDYSSISEAISAAAVTHGVVLFPANRTFLISQTLNIPSGVSLKSTGFAYRGIDYPVITTNSPTITLVNIVGSPVDVEFGGTATCITLQSIALSRKVSAGASSIGVNVQYAQFINIVNCPISNCLTCVAFANVNGLTIRDSTFSNDVTAAGGYAIRKSNTQGATGITVDNLIYYSQSAQSVCIYDRTGGGQAGDRYYNNIQAAGDIYRVIDYASAGGFSEHVFIQGISADSVYGTGIYIDGAGTTDPDLVHSACISNCWFNGSASGTADAIVVYGYAHVHISNVSHTESNQYGGIVVFTNALDCVASNLTLANRDATTGVRAAHISGTSKNCIISGMVTTATGAIWVDASCANCIIMGCILKETVQNASSTSIVANNVVIS